MSGDPPTAATGRAAGRDPLRRALLDLLAMDSAHLDLEAALAALAPGHRARRAPAHPHSVWELLEHMRIAQEDILRYTLDADWRSPPWPQGYWPEPPEGELDVARWQATLDGFRRDLDELRALAADPRRDLLAEIPHGEGRTYLRQLLLVADHNAYHLGQIVLVRRALGDPPG